jgi:long-chain acyl-CoA synthetase
MPSVLDTRIDEAIANLSVPGGPLPLTDHVLPSGVSVPSIAAAPPTLIGYFAHFCGHHGDADFIVDGSERLSFAQAHAMATRIAHALVADFGVQKGDRIGLAMRNAPSWIVLYMAIMMAGGVATLLNGWWQGGELCDGIADVDAKLVFADPPRVARIAECGRKTGCEIVQVDVALPIEDAMAPVLMRGGEGATLPEVGPDDLATILFTSGSTGQSKGAYSTHRAVV